MTKNEELQILRDAARKLGPHSYCGPWLTAAIPVIERDIRSDLAPDPLTVGQHAAQIIREAEDVLRRAKAEADIIVKAAMAQKDEARQIRLAAARAVAQAHQTLEKIGSSLS